MAAESFFSRWSQRKLAERPAKPSGPPPPSAAPGGPSADGAPAPGKPAVPATPDKSPNEAGAPRAGVAAPQPAPTLQDVAALHRDSDFTPFVARAVQPEVRNAALKKLFSDPHFNVMDGLDTYIDDYAAPDPLPAAMLRRMASAQFLRLFDDDDAKAGKPEPARAGAPAEAAEPREDADGAAPTVVAQSPTTSEQDPGSTPDPETGPMAPHDEDTDLRLQPDDAAGPARPGRGTE